MIYSAASLYDRVQLRRYIGIRKRSRLRKQLRQFFNELGEIYVVRNSHFSQGRDMADGNDPTISITRSREQRNEFEYLFLDDNTLDQNLRVEIGEEHEG